MIYLNISDIIIPDKFKKTRPREWKIEKAKKYLKDNNELDQPLVIKDGTLVDNHTRYLAAVEMGFEKVPCVMIGNCKNQSPTDKLKRPVTYIVGKFKHSEKEYVWKLTKKIPIKIGDRVLVWSGYKSKNIKNKEENKEDKRVAVKVVNIFTSIKPELLVHKEVIRKLK